MSIPHRFLLRHIFCHWHQPLPRFLHINSVVEYTWKMVPTKASFPAWREDGPPTHKSKLRLYHTQKQLIIYPLTLKENCLYFQSGPYLTRQETLQLRHIFRHDVFNGEWAISRMLCVPNPVFTAQEVYTRRRVRRMDVHMSIILFS